MTDIVEKDQQQNDDEILAVDESAIDNNNKDSNSNSEVLKEFVENQNKLLTTFLQQQAVGLAKLGLQGVVTGKNPLVHNQRPGFSGSDAPPAKKAKPNEEDAILDLGEKDDIDNELNAMDEGDNENDPFSQYHNSRIGDHGNESILDEGDDADEEEAAALAEKYKDMLSQAEEKMGPPLKASLAKLCGDTWGKAVLDQDKKKELMKEVEIPKNCTMMKTPKLNTEIYVRLYDSGRDKDKEKMARQTELAKATIPLFKSIGKLEEAQRIMTKEWKNRKAAGKSIHATKAEREVQNVLEGIYPLLMQSMRILNYGFTETTRKRKYDVCNSLGDTFQQFASTSKSSEDFLFDDDAYKKMKSELKNVKIKSSRKTKNYHGSRKSSGSQHRQQSHHYPQDRRPLHRNNSGHRHQHQQPHNGNRSSNGSHQNYNQRGNRRGR